MNCRFALLVTLAYTLALGADVNSGPSTKAAKNGPDPLAARGNIRVPKQVGSSGATVDDSKDHQQSAGHHFGHGHGHHFGGGHGHHGLGHGHYGDSKYFQYAHNPHYGEYEFGYRRGNDYHFQERYERAHGWNFKTKVKWGDKYAGYGEHYWDYNHPDKGHDGGHGGDDGGHGHYSENVPAYDKPEGGVKIPNKRQSLSAQDAEGRDKGERDAGVPAVSNKRPASKASAAATVQKAASSTQARLTLNPMSGQITDEVTGKKYVLKPANY